MILTTFNSQSVYLCNLEPWWGDRVTVAARSSSTRTRSLTGRETRRPLRETLLMGLSYTSILGRPALLLLRDALQALNDEPVICPVWPLAVAGSEWSGAGWSGGILVAWDEGWTTYTVATSIASPGDYDFVAPAIMGRIQCGSSLLTAEQAAVEIGVEEDSRFDYAVSFTARTWSTGPALPDTSVPKVFPFRVNWEDAPNAGTAEVVAERAALGDGRVLAGTVYPQTGDRPLVGLVSCWTAVDVAKLFRWWQDQHGSGSAFYVSGLQSTATLASAAAAGQNKLNVTEAGDLGANRYLLLETPELQEWVKVASISGDELTLVSNLGAAWSVAGTLITCGVLARHAVDELQVDFTEPGCAEAMLSWREVPAEYALGAGETRGTTIGALSVTAWLYQVTLDWNGTTEVHRMTSHERDVVASGNTWTARSIEHSDIVQSMALDGGELTVESRYWSGCPWRVFLPGAQDCQVFIAIYDCTVSGGVGSSVSQVFGGSVVGGRFDGPMFSGQAAGANALLDRRVPRITIQPTCNHALFDGGCGLTRANWAFSAEVVSASGTEVVLDTWSLGGGLPTGWGFVHYFAGGVLERTVAGIPQRHLILDSTVLTTGEITLTLATTPNPAPAANEAVTVSPGCNGFPATCKAYHATTNPPGKFNNFDNFGGFPLVPESAPEFTGQKSSDSTQAKK